MILVGIFCFIKTKSFFFSYGDWLSSDNSQRILKGSLSVFKTPVLAFEKKYKFVHFWPGLRKIWDFFNKKTDKSRKIATLYLIYALTKIF